MRLWRLYGCLLMLLIFGIFASHLRSQTPLLEEALVLHYDFVDGKAVDRSRLENHGRVHATQVKGIVNDGLAFDGVEDVVDIGEGNGLNITGPLTYAAWVRFEGLATQDRTILKRCSNYGVTLFNPNGTGKLAFQIKNEFGKRHRVISTSDYNDNEWHHVVGIFNGTEVEIFVDGQSVAAGAVPEGTAVFYQFSHATVGRYANEKHSYWQGSIDEVRIYNTALEPTHVGSLYQQDLPEALAGETATEPTGPSLVLRYDFTDGIANDLSGNGNNGRVDASSVDGVVGGGLAFDGKKNSVDIGEGQDLNLTGPQSYAAWVKFEGTSEHTRTLVKRCSNYGVTLFNPKNTGKLAFQIREENATKYPILSTADYNDNEWHHVVGIFDGTQVELFVDGSSVGSEAVPEGTQIYYQYPYSAIGRYANEKHSYWDGRIDEVHIYNGAIGSSEIASLYEEGVAALAATSEEGEGIPEAGLVLHYNFTDGAAIDQSGNNNDGRVLATLVKGVLGDALSFDGIQSVVDIGEGSHLDLTGPQSYAAWVKFDGSAPNDRTVLKRCSNYGATLFSPRDTGRLAFQIKDAEANKYRVVSTTDYNDNQWHYVAGVFTGDALQLYVDGTLVGSEAVPEGTRVYYQYDISAVGRYANEKHSYWEGMIDEVQIYDGVLSAEAVMAAFEAAGLVEEEVVAEAGEGWTKIADLEEPLRMFEQLEEEDGQLLVWGSFNKLYLARTSHDGQILIAAKEVLAVDDRLTGIGKPIRFKKNWLIPIRETSYKHIDRVHLVQVDTELGKLVAKRDWLQGFERISLPVFTECAPGCRAYYFASTGGNGWLYSTEIRLLAELPLGNIKTHYNVEGIYPPVVKGVVDGSKDILLIFHRGNNPPPMAVLYVDRASQSIVAEHEIEHEGEYFRQTVPVVGHINGQLQLAWQEWISPMIPPRLIYCGFDVNGNKVITKTNLASHQTVPSKQLSWEGNQLSGIVSGRRVGSNSLTYLSLASMETENTSLTKSSISPTLETVSNAIYYDVISLDKGRQKGLFFLESGLYNASYQSSGEEIIDLESPDGNPFEVFKACLKENRLRSDCIEEVKGLIYE